TAVERFNEGFLPQSASIIGLAEKIIAAKEVDGTLIEIVRSKGDEQLDPERMRKYAETSSQHLFLRKVFNFFTALTPAGLLESLRRELKRERRRLLLLLLECHGEATRSAALGYLRNPSTRDLSLEEIYFRRNIVYLLRRIPASAGESLEETVSLVLPNAELGLPLILVKETLAYLSQLKHEKVEQFLQQMLGDTEAMLLNSQGSPYESSELLPLLDRVVSCLCRMATHGSRKAVIDHAFKRKTELGDTMGRLAELGLHSLADDAEILDQLTAALKSNLPLKMLGVVLHNRDYNAKCLVEALGGTLIPSVRQAFEDLIRKYPEQHSGRAAAAILSKHDASSGPVKTSEIPSASLMGDVDLFGLPSLLQNFAESSVTGNFILKSVEGQVCATVKFYKGKIRSCRAGELSSDDAFYQLFERPQPGTFQFVRTAEEDLELETECKEILPLVMEGIRRYDELQRSRIIVPDDVRLKAKTAQPSPLAEEKNGLLFRDIWNAVQSGATAVECEAIGNVDSYRIRRLLVHWLDTGAIETI
ncbi:MAG TPA: DUF4388 domain-containing protein, partial [Acidobacteriota bacterium]|nr:DUF4388 domain-containing protein [Acidobacteriota bacterium]